MPSIVDVSKVAGGNNYKKISSKLTFDKGEVFSARAVNINGGSSGGGSKAVMVRLLDGWQFQAEVDENTADIPQGVVKFEVEGSENGKLKIKLLNEETETKDESSLEQVFKNNNIKPEQGDFEIVKAMIKHNLPLTKANISEIKNLINLKNGDEKTQSEFIDKYIESKGVAPDSEAATKIRGTLTSFFKELKKLDVNDILTMVENGVDVTEDNIKSFISVFKSEETTNINAKDKPLYNHSESNLQQKSSDSELPQLIKSVNTIKDMLEAFEGTVNKKADAEVAVGTVNKKADAEAAVGTVNKKAGAEAAIGTVNNKADAEVAVGTVNNKADAEVAVGTVNNKADAEVAIGTVNNKDQQTINRYRFNPNVMKYSDTAGTDINMEKIEDIKQYILDLSSGSSAANREESTSTYVNNRLSGIVDKLNKLPGDGGEISKISKTQIYDIKDNIDKLMENLQPEENLNSSFEDLKNALSGAIRKGAADEITLQQVSSDLKTLLDKVSNGDVKKISPEAELIKAEISKNTDSLKNLINEVISKKIEAKPEIFNKVLDMIKDNLNNVKVFNSVSNQYYCMDLPVNINDYTYGCKFLIKDDRKKDKGLDSKNIKMVASVKTRNMGVVDAFIKVDNKNMSLNFKCEKPWLKVIDMGKDKIATVLKGLGYNCKISVEKKEQDADLVNSREFFEDSNLNGINARV